MIRSLGVAALAVSWVLLGSPSTFGQSLKKQLRDSDTPITMAPTEIGELGDPFFLLVLKDHIDTVSLDGVETLLQPAAAQRQLFVVSERAAELNSTSAFRTVLTYQGTVNGIALSPNVMLSAVFTKDVFPENDANGLSFIESWGWDDARGRFNYYRLDKTAGTLSWKFRGSSVGADQLTNTQRAGTCFSCHFNGGPIMKELLNPWNHWHSEDFPLRQLSPLESPPVRWNVAMLPRFIGVSGAGGLKSAFQLDPQIRSSIKTFVQSRVQGSLESAPGGLRKVKEAQRLLQSLFITTEFNIISSRVQSNRHPLSSPPLGEPSLPVSIPASFFLNADFIAGGGQPGFKGLEIADALHFPGIGVANLTPQEYVNLVDSSGLKVDGKPGDALFSWLAPEPSNFDNQMCDVLVRRGVVPGQFAAAVQAIDLRTPLLSSKRAKLLEYMPAEYEIGPASPGDPLDVTFFSNHDLTQKVIQSLTSASPVAGSVEAEFLSLLRQDAGPPLEVLRQRVKDYAMELQADMQNSTTRPVRLQQLFDQLLETRERVLADDKLGRLDETGGRLLFPAR